MRTEIVYGWLFTSVLVLFVVLDAIQVHELSTIKLKVGSYSPLVFNSTCQVLTKFHKVCTKSLFSFRKKGSENTYYLSKKTTLIYVFISNKLDFRNCFLTFITLKLCTNIKNLSKSQF